MSSHADTIRRAIDYRSRFADKADDALDALLAENRIAEELLNRERDENQRLREALLPFTETCQGR